jgi:hypothetical protein
MELSLSSSSALEFCPVHMAAFGLFCLSIVTPGKDNHRSFDFASRTNAACCAQDDSSFCATSLEDGMPAYIPSAAKAALILADLWRD